MKRLKNCHIYLSFIISVFYSCDEGSNSAREAVGEIDQGSEQMSMGPVSMPTDAPTSSLPLAWTLPSNLSYLSTGLIPEVPAVLRDVHLIDDQVQFTKPYIPAHRTTADGRIAVRVQGGYPGTERIATHYSFFLFTPERLQEPIMPGASGAQILANTEPFDVIFPPALESRVNRFGHHAICDPYSAFTQEGEKTNPYPCGEELNHDCYDFTMISSTATSLTAQLWGTEITVEITEPKTARARIISANLDEPKRGPTIPITNELLEPAITLDGRLLTARLGRAPRNWVNPNTGEMKRGFYDLVYFPPNENFAPCDVNAWNEWQPMSHAPYDPRMIGKYGLAAQPFRDTEGALIPDGDDMGGTYPWVDREGANVFMSGISGRMIEQSETDYPRVCVVEGCENLTEKVDWDRGVAVGGLWTHGKFVLLDSMINHLDWSIGVTPRSHYLVDLYTREQSEEPVAVRLGAGRFINSVRNEGGPYPPGYTHNPNIIDSLQNLLNQHPHVRTVTPRDVVWLMSNGVATDEVVFDDFLDPQAFIYSNMQASFTQFYSSDGQPLSVPKYWNGQVRRLKVPLPVPDANELIAGEHEEIHVQNAATSTIWTPPNYGYVKVGKGRIEPAALGGIVGKGFWLDGSNEVSYEIMTQPQDIRQTPWIYSLFIDPRMNDERGVLLSFPDGSLIEWSGNRVISYIQAQEVIHQVRLPDPLTDTMNTNGEEGHERWIHLAWRVDHTNKHIELIYNGFPFDRFESEQEVFLMTEGHFVVGYHGEQNAGFRGWIDELKVLAHDVNPEVMCNHGLGTLVRIEDHPHWLASAEKYPDWAHHSLSSHLGDPLSTRYACYHDYRHDFAAHLQNIPRGTDRLRELLIFPEGPLRLGEPRPDSSENSFCLSCHQANGLGGLSLKALEYRSEMPTELDPRRQPTQPPRRVFGHIPADWLSGSPEEALVAPNEGILIDSWLLQAP